MERTLKIADRKIEAPVTFVATGDYQEYIGQGNRTARMASEQAFASPEPDLVTQAVRVIRNDISSVLSESDALEAMYDLPSTLEQTKEKYWEEASRVGVEHGAKPGYELEDYLNVGSGRSYDEIKASIEKEYDEGSVPRSILDGIEAYHKVLQINPSYATTIMMELVGRNLGDIKHRADLLQKQEGYVPQDATTHAISQYITEEVPYHINTIIDQCGYGDETIRPKMNKGSFYPPSENEATDHAALVLTEKDATGLIDVYDIQSRPYDAAQLKMGNDIAHIPEMQMAMLRVQEGLIEMSKVYLAKHPERASASLENFSEMFVPEYADGHIVLLPNPKLLRAMVNNVMPAVAMNIMERGGTVESVDENDIQAGVRIASKEFKLFQSRIGQFNNRDKDAGTVELQSTFQVVCPANAMFPGYLSENLAKCYEEEKTSLANAAR